MGLKHFFSIVLALKWWQSSFERVCFECGNFTGDNSLISVALDFKIQLLFKTILHHDAAILQVTTLKVVDLKFPTRHKYETF